MPLEKKSVRLHAATALALLLLYSLGILGHDLWTPDEPRVAAIAQQVSEGAWVVPTLNDSPFLEQPPLYYWCVALVYKLFGCDRPESGRIVSSLFGLGGLLGTYLLAYHLGRVRGGDGTARGVAMLAALALGLSVEYLSTAHRVLVDSCLVCFTTLSAYGLLRGLTSSQPGPRLAWLVSGYASASLAFLAKGPIGLAIPGLALFAMVLALRQPQSVRRAHLWLGPVCFIAITGPWFYLLHQETGWAGFEEIFVTNFLGRALPIAEVQRAHTRPFYYYALHTPVLLLPTTLFLAGAILRRFRERATLEAAERTAYDLSLWWFGAGFVLLSVATTKRGLYMVPLYPAAAVAGAYWLEAYLEKRANGGYERALGYVLAALLLVLALALPIAQGVLKGEAIGVAVLGGVVGVSLSLATWVAAAKDRRETMLFLTVIGFTTVSLAALNSVVPAIDEVKSLARPSRLIASVVPADHSIHALRPDETTEGMIPLYTGRRLEPLGSPELLEQKIEELGRVYLLTVEKRRHEPGSPRWKRSRTGSVEHLRHEVLLYHEHPIWPTRTFRVLLFRRHP